MDPIVSVLVVAACVLLAEQLSVLVTDRLGDTTARAAGRLWSTHRLVDRLGTVLVPALLAIVSQGWLMSFGWAAPNGGTRELLSWRKGALAALTAPITHLAIAGGGLLVHALTIYSVDHPSRFGNVAVLATNSNMLMAAFLLLPLPMLPGGRLLRPLLPSARRAGWDRWARRSRAIPGVPMAALIAWRVSSAGAGVLLLS